MNKAAVAIWKTQHKFVSASRCEKPGRLVSTQTEALGVGGRMTSAGLRSWLRWTWAASSWNGQLKYQRAKQQKGPSQ